MGSSLTISIVLFLNPREQIERVLSSVRGSKVSYELFLIDNSPEKSHFAWLELRKNEIYHFVGENIGFGAGHNFAIKKALSLGPEFHLVLNPDVYFDEKVLPEIIRYMGENNDVGLITPKVLYPNGSVQYLCKRLPKPYDLFVRRFGPKALKEKNNYYFEMRDQNYNAILEVPSLSGCFMFFRMSVLVKIQGFDERFFMYLEDVDISRRSGEIAKNIHYPLVHIFHEHGQGSYKSFKLLWYHIRSTFQYFLKWGV